MWNWAFWRDLGERGIRTFAAALAAWLATENGSWFDGLSLAALAALYTALMAIGTHGVTGNGPSFTSVYKPPRGQDDDSRT